MGLKWNLINMTNQLSSYDDRTIIKFWEACKKIKAYVPKLECEKKVLAEIERRKIKLTRENRDS